MRNITPEITGIPEFISVVDKSCALHPNVELIPLDPESYRGEGKTIWFSETLLSKAIAKKLKGKTEVSVKGIGKIDVLTNQAVIECKAASKWKEGLGQVLAYSYYYPDKEKWLVLFSISSSILFKNEDNRFDIVTRINELSDVCFSYGVSLKLVSEISFERSIVEVFRQAPNPDYQATLIKDL